jgi:uncharacterized iron-regulated membrane protein
MTYRVRNPDLHQEDDIVAGRRVLLAILVTLVISGIMVTWAVSANAAHEAAFRPSGVFPERWLGSRHMVAGVREDLFGEQPGASSEAGARAELDGYGWVDRERRVARIPIAVAMDLVLAGRRP